MNHRTQDRWLRKTLDANPGYTVTPGSRHIKIIRPDGKLAGILPYSPSKEGLSRNLISQLRRNGMTI
jgi:hypothetical protein